MDFLVVRMSIEGQACQRGFGVVHKYDNFDPNFPPCHSFWYQGFVPVSTKSFTPSLDRDVIYLLFT